jgi:hypothetical protein
LRLPSGREVTLEHGQRVLAEAMRDATESGATREEVAAKLGAVLDETTPFSKENYKALLKRAREAGATYRAQFAEREQQTGSKLTPTHTTFADLLAAGKAAVVCVLETDHNRCARLLEHLFVIGGARVKGLDGSRRTVLTTDGDVLAFGPVTVWIAHRVEQTMGWPRGADVAVGFGDVATNVLLDGSALSIDVRAEDAPRFWGIDQSL